MANTQGLSDEALESLMSSTARSAAMPSSRPSRARNALNQRLDMPFGERPAATVVRKSTGKRATPISVPEATAYEASAAFPDENGIEQSGSSSNEPPEIKPPVLGSVMERQRQPAETFSTKTTVKKASRFAQQQRQLSDPSGQGFPSLDRPLGTFVIKANKTASLAIKASPVLPHKSQSAAAGGTASLETLQIDAERDAQAMMEGLSVSEIKEKQMELKGSLSADMIAFLQRRAGKKNVDANDPDTATSQSNHVAINEKDVRHEKERLAQVLSSIQTYDDLDDAMAAEVGDDPELSKVEGSETKNDFDLACDLLRSSVPRQNLWAAKQIVEKLTEDLHSGRCCSLSDQEGLSALWPYPDLLPVSVRCLLDSPLISRPNGQLLCLYVLESIYLMLQLRAHPAHVVDVTGTQSSASDMFQLYYMNDAVPTPRASACYSSAPATSHYVGEGDQPVAYSTESTTKSAQADADSFQRDPMWTLLSRMRILPRLAHLLNNTLPYALPSDAVRLICGILSMLAQRSPGAASAIVQHETLLLNIKCLTLNLPNVADTSHNHSSLGLSAMILLCTLARQSRVAAEGLDVENIILRVLASEALDETQHQMQQRALILWRTMLQYGLCHSILQPLLTLAAPSTTLGHGRFSIAAEYFSALTCVCDLARFVSRSSSHGEIADEVAGSLSHTAVWLVSFSRQAQYHLSSLPEKEAYTPDFLKLMASCVHFLDSYLLLSEREPNETGGEFKVENMSLEEGDDMCDSIVSLMQSHVFATALDTALQSFKVVTEVSAIEAASFAFINSILRFVHTAQDLYSTSRASEKVLGSYLIKVLNDGLSRMEINSGALLLRDDMALCLPRVCWQNVFLFHLVTWLASDKYEIALDVRACAFVVFGRLQFGEEWLAARLLSHESLFSSEPSLSLEETSALSTVLVRELCRSRSQLDHSFKLFGRFGIDSAGAGPQMLHSLLSEAEGTNGKDTPLLPMGKMWLWQVLCGSISFGEQGSTEAISVLRCALKLILDFETNEAEGEKFASSLETGGKLYYVMNICLHPDAVSSDATIQSLACKLVDMYSRKDSIGQSFIETSVAHSSSKQTSATSDATDGAAEAEVKKLFDLQTKDSFRVVEEFISDLCEVFIENNAIQALSARCLRVFLLPSFLTRIRCLVLRRLAGLLHLLNVDGDDLKVLLTIYLREDQPSVDASTRDSPELLDVLANVVLKGNETRDDLGFVSGLATGLLARNLAMSARDKSSLTAHRQRLCQLGIKSVAPVNEAAAAFLAKNGTFRDLVECICSPTESCFCLPDNIFNNETLDWDATLAFLSNIKKRTN
ncbi:hypothetical protein MPSEU_000959400 [Mayamaea pseudoterrestris]|nr:hypothetical protein MPSEU_000959400 [Mayamaea pseudoterrestris]